MADIDDFDLDASTAQAWTGFQERLAEVIAVIDESGDLIIEAESASDGEAAYVAFRSPTRHVVRVETPAAALNGQPTSSQVAQLTALGWHTTGAEPAGYAIEMAQEDSDQLSAVAVATLRDVFGVPHPVFLAPSQLAEVLWPAPHLVPADDPPRSVPAVVPGSREHLDELVSDELTALHGHRPVRDHEGDVAIRVGSTMMFLRIPPDGQEIVIFAAVVHDLAGRSRAAEVLNDLNVEARWVKFQLVRDRVFVTLSILARPFVGLHLRQALTIISDVADGIDEELAAKLSGRTTFSGDHDEAP